MSLSCSKKTIGIIKWNKHHGNLWPYILPELPSFFCNRKQT